MKTIDEVIKARKICDAVDTECDGCPYDREWHFEDGQTTTEVVSCMRELGEDTLHYLKEFQRKLEELNEACKKHEQLYIEYRERIDALDTLPDYFDMLDFWEKHHEDAR